jgi:putative membrane protein
MTAPERAPRAFAPDDTALIEEAPWVEAPPRSETPPAQRAGFGELRARGLKWGLIAAAAAVLAALLAAFASLERLIAAALARGDWLGWSVEALLLVAGLAALVVLAREAMGLARLARLTRLKREVTAALERNDAGAERRAALRLAALYRRRPELAWSRARFLEHLGDVRDRGELMLLAERELIAPLDARGQSLVTRAAKRVAAVTALAPVASIAVGYVLIENVRLLRALAALYGGRPGLLGGLRLARLVLAHIVATGGLALTDDLLGQFLGQDLLRRLSRRLGEGAFNGALTARVGLAAMGVIRPLPYLAARPARLRDVLAEAIKPLLRAGPKEPPQA